MTAQVMLPREDRRLRPYMLSDPPAWPATLDPPSTRRVFAAAHVVADPLARDGDHPIDWETTLAFRRHLWRHGLGVAEAMDTAQRGGGLHWPMARELMLRTLDEGRAAGGEVVCGAATDQLPAGGAASLEDIVGAYLEQCEAIEDAGGKVVVMASRQLAATARSPDDYAEVYGRVLTALRHPAILHWLGVAFDPALANYWGGDLDRATEALLAIVADHAGRVDGVKLSLLDVEREIELRRRLPRGVRLYTGDDFHFPELIAGDEHGHSDALLGAFDPIAAPAAVALQALDAGDRERFAALLAPTVPLVRHAFSTPTSDYKTSVVFLAFLAGHQKHFRMVDGRESARSVLHLTELLVHADRAGVLPDPELAAERMNRYLALAGVV